MGLGRGAQSVWLPDAPNAAVVGHVYGFIAVPPFAGLQAKYLARVASGAATLPPPAEMRAWIAEVEAKYGVTQRLTENHYVAEVRFRTSCFTFRLGCCVSVILNPPSVE